MSSASAGKDDDDVLEQEQLHDTQAEMERVSSIPEMLASIPHVKRYVMASNNGNDTLINWMRALQNRLRSQCVQQTD